MEKVFSNLSDFETNRGTPLNGNCNGSISEFIKNQAYGIVVRRALSGGFHTSGEHNFQGFYDTVLLDNPFLVEVQHFNDRLFTRPSTNRGRPLSVDNDISKPLSLLYFVFSKEDVSAFDQVCALNLIHRLKNHCYNDDYTLNPVGSFGTRPCAIKTSDLKVSDFGGISLLKMKSTHANLCHSLEPFVMLEEEINKIEDGLWDKLKDSIERMFKADNYKDFFKEGLLFVGLTDPHLTESARSSSVVMYELWDGSGFQAPVPKPKDTTLLTKFNLDCHCHSRIEDWKHGAIPLIINTAFNMKVA